MCLSQSRRLPLLQVVSNNKSFSVGVQSPTEINAPRGCAVILRRICQLALTRITHQVSRAFDLNALPGGIGTLDEISETITLTKIGVFHKPSILFNRNGFYEPLKQMFQTMEDAGFLAEDKMKHVLFSDDLKEMEGFLREWL